MGAFDRRKFLATVGSGTLAAGTVGWVGTAIAAGKIKIGANDGLIAIDVQNCFIPGGSLAVPKGEEVVPIINALAAKFSVVVMTQDWHPEAHMSFASTHKKEPFSAIDVNYGKQVMWPDHCIQGTDDANLHSGLDLTKANLILRKGFNPKVDGYSAFYDNDKKSKTGLSAYLKARGVNRVFVCGLATDFCVMWSAVDARKDGFRVMVIEDASRGIDLGGKSIAAAWKDMGKAGVKRIQSTDIA
ncbi:MAG: bifunctional nicotinamidase/pyrazinamidase [Burkholderiales bacterium]